MSPAERLRRLDVAGRGAPDSTSPAQRLRKRFERLYDRLAVMELALQSSLFDHAERRNLGSGAWVEVRSGWLTDAESLFGELMQHIPRRAERRQMYERMLDVPRL